MMSGFRCFLMSNVAYRDRCILTVANWKRSSIKSQRISRQYFLSKYQSWWQARWAPAFGLGWVDTHLPNIGCEHRVKAVHHYDIDCDMQLNVLGRSSTHVNECHGKGRKRIAQCVGERTRLSSCSHVTTA